MAIYYEGAAIPVFPIYLPDGLISAPSLSFLDDKDTGVYSSAANALDFISGGTQTLTLQSTVITAHVKVSIPYGTVAAPGLCFTSDTDTGFYRSAANTLSVASGAANIMSFKIDRIEAQMSLICASKLQKANKTVVGGGVILNTGSDVFFCDDVGGLGFTLDLPLASSNPGRLLHFVKTDANATAITLDGNGAETINGAATNTDMDAQYDSLSIVSNGIGWFILSRRVA